MIHFTKLTRELCEDLAPIVREHDVVDCYRHDFNPLSALLDGLDNGPAWAVLNDGSVRGACGWTKSGCIWSLWAELDREEVKWVMKHTVTAVKAMKKATRKTLFNYVWEGNRLTLAWLRASKCFNFSGDFTMVAGDKFHFFAVKPLEELFDV